MTTGEQFKGARILLNWSQMTLAQAAVFDVSFIIDFAGAHSRWKLVRRTNAPSKSALR